MLLRLVAPFRCHFNVNNAQTLCQEEAYCQFWERTEKAVRERMHTYPRLRKIEFLHARLGNPAMRYQKLHENGNLIPPETLRITPDDSVVPLLNRAWQQAEEALTDRSLRGALRPLPETLLFHIYDNTIGLLEIAAEGAERFCTGEAEKTFTELQVWTNHLIQNLLPTYYRETLYPLILDLWRLDSGGEFIETPGKYTGFPDVTLNGSVSRSSTRAPDFDAHIAGMPLWTNRTLCIKGLPAEAAEQVLHHWVPTASAEVNLREHVGRPETVFLGWGHNIFHTADDTVLAQDAWQALLLCQYYYTVLESTNLSLSRFVGMTLGHLSRKQTRDLSNRLQEVVSSVNLLVAAFNDTQQNLQGNRQVFLKTLKQRWGIDSIVQSIEKKTAMIAQQIERLYERMTKLSQSVTELMLFAIGGIGLVDFCLDLIVFSRSEAKDPATGPANDGVPGLLDVVAALPPDGVLWGGLGLLAVALAVFLMLQRGRR